VHLCLWYAVISSDGPLYLKHCTHTFRWFTCTKYSRTNIDLSVYLRNLKYIYYLEITKRKKNNTSKTFNRTRVRPARVYKYNIYRETHYVILNTIYHNRYMLYGMCIHGVQCVCDRRYLCAIDGPPPSRGQGTPRPRWYTTVGRFWRLFGETPTKSRRPPKPSPPLRATAYYNISYIIIIYTK